MSEHRSRPGWTKLVGDLERPPESSRTVRILAIAALICAILAAANAGAVRPGAAAAGIAIVIVGGVVSHLRYADMRPWIALLVTLATMTLVLRFVLTHGQVISPAELRGPLAELLLAMECCRAFSLRTRRDLRFALTSSTALVAVGASMAITIAFALPLAAWALVAAAAMAAAHRSELAERAPVPRERVARACARRIALPAAAAISAATVAAVAIFLIVPAARSSRLFAVTSRLPNTEAVAQPGSLSNPTLGSEDPANGRGGDSSGPRSSFGYFGFANRLDTGLRGRPDDTLVMRVRAEAPDFWRGQSFDTWDGRSWSISDERTAVIGGRGPISLLESPTEPRTPGSEFIQTYFLETAGPNVIFGANRATQVYIPQAALFQLTDGTVRTGVELEAGAIYTVVSYRPDATAARLRAAGDTAATSPREVRERYAALGPVPQRVADLAAQVTAGHGTTYDKVRALERWMGDNTKYSLDIPPLPPGTDAVEQFLFVDRTGFCEQIASSLVVMLRSQGIPARLAVGYTPGERNPFTGLFEVRARDAHSWAEVYFPGVGWQAFDPTAAVPLAGDPPPDAARVGLSTYLSRHLGPIARPLLAALAGLIVGVGVLLGWRPLRSILVRRRARRDEAWASRQLRKLEQIGAAAGRERAPAESAGEYAHALQRTVLRDARLDAIARAVDRDAFSTAPLNPHDRAEIEALLGALAERERAEVGSTA